MSKIISIKIEDELFEELEIICNNSGVRNEDFIKQLIHKELEKKPMTLKTSTKMKDNLCLYVLDDVKENRNEWYELPIVVRVNDVKILNGFPLNCKKIEEGKNDTFIPRRVDYINCFGIISSDIRIRYFNDSICVYIKILNRSDDKNKVTWEFADAIRRMLSYEYFKKDFKTMQAFSNAAGFSATFVSKIRDASKFKLKHKDNDYIQTFTIDKNYLLSLLKGWLDDFVEEYGGYEEIEATSSPTLEKDIRKYKKAHGF